MEGNELLSSPGGHVGGMFYEVEKPWSESERKRKKNAAENKPSSEEIEVLKLTHFTSPPVVDFGSVKLNESKCRKLCITNVHEYSQDVVVERYPCKKGFFIDQMEFTVMGESDTVINITWSPADPGNYREMLLFRVDRAYRLQAFVVGKVEEPKPKGKKVTFEYFYLLVALGIKMAKLSAYSQYCKTTNVLILLFYFY